MLRWLIRRKLNAEENKLGESIDYLRHIVNVSPVAFFRFASIMPFANSRKVLSADAWYVAQLIALQQEDCGSCLQITVNLAQQNNVDDSLIHAVLNGDENKLNAEMRDVYRFAESVVTATTDDEQLRETMRQRYGERGLIEMAYAIASGRIPPTVKRTLGYAKSCSQVNVDLHVAE